MSQIDLVPTVALALGLPIPFSSLGMAIPEVFLPFHDTQGHTNRSHSDGYSDRVSYEFLTALRTNAHQIQQYLDTYIHYSDDFPVGVFDSLRLKLAAAHTLHDSIVDEDETRDAKDRQTILTSSASAYVDYIRSVKTMCQSIWAKFDDHSIFKGLIILLLSTCVVPLALLNVSRGIQYLCKAIFFGFSVGTVVGLVSIVLYPPQLDMSPNGLISLVITLTFSSLLLSCLLYLGIMRQEAVVRVASLLASKHNLLSLLYSLSFIQIASLVAILLYSVSLLSNSFILYEGDVVAFFLQSLIICFMFRRLKLAISSLVRPQSEQQLSTILSTVFLFGLLMACVRLTKIFHTCRDLQVGCEGTTFTLSSSSAVESLGALWKWRLLVSCICTSLVPVGLAVFVNKNRSSRFLSHHLLMTVKYGLPVASVCICGFWVIQSLPQSTLDGMPSWQYVLLPRTVFVICSITIALVVLYPFKCHSKALVIHEGNDKHGSTLYQEQSESTPPVAEHQSQVPGHKEAVTVPPAVLQLQSSTVVLPLLVLVVSVWLPVTLVINDAIALSAVVMVFQAALFILVLERSEEGQCDVESQPWL